MCIQDVIHYMDSGEYGPYVPPKHFERHGIKVMGNKELLDGGYKRKRCDCIRKRCKRGDDDSDDSDEDDYPLLRKILYIIKKPLSIVIMIFLMIASGLLIYLNYFS